MMANLTIHIFRPEKDHSMQIKALAKLLEKHPEWRDTPDFELVLIGSARNEGDEKRIRNLQQEAKDLGVQVMMDTNVK